MDNFSYKFETFYSNIASKIVAEHNNNRIQRIKSLVMAQLITLGVVFALITWVSCIFSFNSTKFGIIIFILSLPTIYTVFYLFNPVKVYESKFKHKFMNELLKIFGTFEWHHGASSFNITTNNSIIFPKKFLLTYDDVIYGWFKEKLEVTINECKTERNSFLAVLPILIPAFLFTAVISFILLIIFPCVFSNGKTIMLTWYNPYTYFFYGFVLLPFAVFIKLAWSSINRGNFHGIVLQCNLPKNFECTTYFYENNPFTNKNVDRKAQKSLEKVALEYMDFNDEYQVYSDNQIEARYILTSAFIERLYNIRSIFNAKYIRAEFKNNKMLLIMHIGKDLYTFNQYKKLSKDDFKIVFNELYSLFSLLDTLRLDVRTGL